MKYQQNMVIFLSTASNWASFYGSNYSISDFSITSGQDPNGNIFVGNTQWFDGPKSSFITYSIGRKGSDGVASWWSNHVGDSSHNTFNHEPDKLNFAFIGTLTLSQTFNPAVTGNNWVLDDIAIGQGSSGSSNNWWFGGKNCQYADDATNTVVCPGTQGDQTAYFFFQRGSNGVNTIELTKFVSP